MLDERPTLPSRKQNSLLIVEKQSPPPPVLLLQQQRESTPQEQEESSVLLPQSPERRHQTWYYSSNHVLVNRERVSHGLPPLHRSVVLDERARQVAVWAAEGKSLRGLVSGQDAHTYLSGNVLVGSSIRTIHDQIVERSSTHCQRECRNILNPDYTEFGMGTYKDPQSGRLYLCQLFGAGGKAIF